MSAESGGTRIFGPRSLLTVAATLAFALGMLVHFGLSGSTRGLAIMVGVALLTLSAFLASIWRAARGGPEATGWKLLSTSLGIAVVIQAARVLTAMGVPLPDAFNGASLFLPFLGTCLQIGALFFWNLAPRNHFDRIRHGLDGLLFALAIFFILWGLVLGPAFLGDRFPLSERLVYLATFLVYDLLLGLAVYLGMPEPSRFRGPLGWLAAAFLLASLHNFYWLLDALSGVPLHEFPRIPPFIFFIPVAYLGAALSTHPVGSTSRAERRSGILHGLPYLPVLGATALGIWMLIHGTGPGHRLILVWLALALVLVLLVRQYLALRDYSALSQHLETRVAERTLALEEAQALLLRTERLNSMATLGAGLAHDMNSLLCAVQSRAELVILDLDAGRLPNRDDLVRAQEATHLAATMSSRLMALGRQDPEPPRCMDLSGELLAIKPLLEVLLPASQSLRLDPPATAIPFLGTRGLLEQVLMNLVSHARDAMPTGGTITLRARAPHPYEVGLGPLLEVEDSGGGIPSDLQDQIFQPFFTTKPSGIGTGLGLASVKLLLEKSGGSIHFTSRPGQGTTFKVRLPRLSEGA